MYIKKHRFRRNIVRGDFGVFCVFLGFFLGWKVQKVQKVCFSSQNWQKLPLLSIWVTLWTNSTYILPKSVFLKKCDQLFDHFFEPLFHFFEVTMTFFWIPTPNSTEWPFSGFLDEKKSLKSRYGFLHTKSGKKALFWPFSVSTFFGPLQALKQGFLPKKGS